MTKIWEVVNTGETAKILFYGEITSGELWNDDYMTPRAFAETLDSLKGKPLEVRINSAGGNVFAANAIYAQMRAYKGRITVYIDGLAASAATIIAMAGDRVIMPANALMMIHNPAIGLSDYLTAEQLTRYAESLEVIKESILKAYMGKCKLSRDQLSQMMDSETWLTADECMEYGFCDKVAGNVEVDIAANALNVCGRSYDLKAFADPDRLKVKIAAASGRKESDNMTKLEQILNKFGLLEEAVEPVIDAASKPNTVDAEAVVAAERKRVADLDALRNVNRYLDAVIEMAKRTGKTAEEIKDYADALTAVEPERVPAQTLVTDAVADSVESGVDAIAANANPQAKRTSREESIDMMCEIFKNMKAR